VKVRTSRETQRSKDIMMGSPSSPSGNKTNAKDATKRRELPAEAVAILRQWLLDPEHFDNPYPSPEDQAILIEKTGIDKKQLKNWFINARRRIWKPMLKKKLEEAHNGGGGTHSRLVPILPSPSPSSNKSVPTFSQSTQHQTTIPPAIQLSASVPTTSNIMSDPEEQVLPEIVTFTPDRVTMSKMGLGNDGTVILCSEHPPRLPTPPVGYEWSTFVVFAQMLSNNGKVTDLDMAKAIEAGDGSMFHFVVPHKLRDCKIRLRICLVAVMHVRGVLPLQPETNKAVASTMEIALKSPNSRFESSSDIDGESFLLSVQFQANGNRDILILSQISEEVFEPIDTLAYHAFGSNEHSGLEDEDFQRVLRWIRDEPVVQDGVATEVQANKRRKLAGGLYTLDSEGLPQVPTPEWMPVLSEKAQVIMEYMGVGFLPVIGACLGYSFYGICYTFFVVAIHTLSVAMTDWGPESNYFRLSWTPLSPAMHVLWADAFFALHLCVIILLFPQYFGTDPKFAAGLVFATWTGDTILGYHTLLTKQRKGEIALRKIMKSGTTKKRL